METVDGQQLSAEPPMMTRAGDLIFVGAQMAIDADGIPQEAKLLPGWPWHGSSIERQLSYIYRRLDIALKDAGSSLNHIVKDNWYHTDPTDINMAVRTRRQWIEADTPPPQTRVIVPELPAHGISIAFDAIALAADSAMPREPVVMSSVPPTPYEEIFGWAGFSQAIRGGGLIFTRGMSPTDQRGPLPEILPDPERPYRVNQIRFQTEFELRRLRSILADAGASLEDVVRAEVHLADMTDLGVLDEVWRDFFGSDPPVRIVIPASLAIPGMVVEIELIATDPAGPYRKETVAASDVLQPLGHESQIARAGPYVFLGPQLATDYENGMAPDARPRPGFPFHLSSTRLEVEYIQRNVERLCVAAGTTADSLVRRRAVHRDLHDWPEAEHIWRGWTSGTLPSTTVFRADGPLPVPECSVLYDLIAYAGA